ncbi:MAG: ATP-binding protein [Sphingomonas sp.]|jgi:nitrogen fixation/metabolism regulation signal transduction histidine kinase|uniref:sensor histidine kinase n=1 Tax=Sphingomonas sp. TaxID=28214 RepID=UPI0035674E67
MGFDRRFTLILGLWIGALLVALAGFIWSFEVEGLGAARIVAGLIVLSAAGGLWNHVDRTNRTVARFVEALNSKDFATRFDGRGGAGFSELGGAMDAAMRGLQEERDRSAREMRYLEALVDDMPVALLTIDEAHGVTPANKAARRLFSRHQGVRPEAYAVYGATFASRLDVDGETRQELLILRMPGGPQRAIVRSASLERLGLRIRAVTVEPVQGTLDTVEMAAQTDLVRVLTHEILNSLTPVTSLAGTAEMLLDAEPPDVADARVAVTTLSRRAEGLRRFIDSYRAVSHAPTLRRRPFEAAPFVAELAKLFAAEWVDVPLTLEVQPDVTLDADPDLLAQVLINLLRNAAEAAHRGTSAHWVRLSLSHVAGRVWIEVEDSGTGVPENLRRDIFLPFFTTRAEGTGVGLNLARQVVVAHGGSIDIADGRTGGALFRIIL